MKGSSCWPNPINNSARPILQVFGKQTADIANKSNKSFLPQIVVVQYFLCKNLVLYKHCIVLRFGIVLLCMHYSRLLD